MRTKTKTKPIIVSEDIHQRLKADRKHFQETIGGGKWSIADTIQEYQKILDLLNK